LFLVPAVAFVALLAVATARTGNVAVPGEPAPDFEAPLLERSGTFRLSELSGRPIFINFWWSGCVPCKEEAPVLAGAHDRYGDEVAFVGINIKDARSEALAFARENDLDFTHVRDDGRLYDLYGLTGQPESFFIDRRGILVDHVLGPTDEEGLFSLLEALSSRG